MCYLSCVMYHLSCVMCNVSFVICLTLHHLKPITCHRSPVTCRLSLLPTATAIDLPLLTPPLCTERKDPPKLKISKRKKSLRQRIPKMYRGIPILVICSLTRSLQSTGKLGLQAWTVYRQTDIATYSGLIQ